MRHLLALSLFLIFISCQKEPDESLSLTKLNNQQKIQNRLNQLLDQYMILQDSLSLKYPEFAIPKLIYDIDLDENNIYVCGLSNQFPIVKFDLNGNFIRTIGKMGRGPGEFMFEPEKISFCDEYLAVCDGVAGNSVFIFKNDQIYKQELFPTHFRCLDVEVFSQNNLIIASTGYSKHHLLITNMELEHQYSLIKTPALANINRFIPDRFWALQRMQNRLLSSFLFPPELYYYNILQDSIVQKGSTTLRGFKNFLYPDSTKIIDMLENNSFNTRGIIDLVQSFGKLKWIIGNDTYQIGRYDYHENTYSSQYTRKIQPNLFISKNDKIVWEKKISFDEGLKLIPCDDKLIVYHFSKFSDHLQINIFIWKMDLHKLNLNFR